MGHLKIYNRVDASNNFDLNELLKYLVPTTGIFGMYWKYIDNKFKEEKLKAEQAKFEREEFITKVAEKAVQTAMAIVVSEFRNDIDTLFRYREEDRKHIDQRLDNIVKEIRK